MEELTKGERDVLVSQLRAIQAHLERNRDMRTTDEIGQAFEELIVLLQKQ